MNDQEKKDLSGLTAVDFKPLEEPGKGKKLPLSPGVLIVAVVSSSMAESSALRKSVSIR